MKEFPYYSSTVAFYIEDSELSASFLSHSKL